MLMKYLLILCMLTPDLNYSLSIRKDIDFAKQFLKYHGIPDPDLCTEERMSSFCANKDDEVCSARLSKKKMEFKQFENPCYMDFNNFCKSQDNIWTIKNSGPCVMGDELRRFAKEIEKTAAVDTNSTDTRTDDDKTDDNDTTTDDTATDETTTDETDSATETTADAETTTDDVEEVTETVPDDTTEISTDVNEALTLADDNDETRAEETETTTDEMNTEDETDVLRKAEEDDTNDETTIAEETGGTTDAIETNSVDTTLSIDEIGKIFYDDGSVKALREAPSTRFPPTRAKMSWLKTPCAKRVKPCPDIYFPVCLYNNKEKPNNISYYHFINSCEAEQYTCYHPEQPKILNDPIEGSSSIRAGFCAHIQYINYARYVHTMSAWGHYGWLHGPFPFNHILKPHERA